MAVNRQDPDFLSSQVDSAAESMRQTEKAVSELQHLTGLGDQLRSRRRSSNPICARCCGMTPDPAPASSRGPAGVVSGVGLAAGRPLLLGNDRRVRAARQHLRSLPDRRGRRTRATACSPSSWPSSCSAAGRWCCTTTSGRGLRAFARPRREAAQGDGRARQQEGRRPERAAEGSRRDLRDPRSVRPQQHHGGRGRSPEPRGDHRSGLVRVPVRRARPPQPAGVVAARDDAELGDEPARQAAEHGVRADRREARRT